MAAVRRTFLGCPSPSSSLRLGLEAKGRQQGALELGRVPSTAFISARLHICFFSILPNCSLAKIKFTLDDTIQKFTNISWVVALKMKANVRAPK